MSEQYPSQQQGSVLDIRPGFLFFAFLLFFFKPSYSINGSPPVQGQWKQNVLHVPSGRYQVTVWVSYLFRPQMGISTVVVDVPPGSAAVVTWRAPLTIFGTGRIAVESVTPMGGGGPQQSQFPGQHQPAQQAAAQPAQQPAQAQPAQTQAATPGGWHADPTGRHQVRYYDGSAWTEHVSDNGTQSRDPIA